MRKTKAKLITTLSIALLSVFTMGVSTFAWFQAQANVNIETESSSTTITVAKPDDFIFYAYRGNTAIEDWANKGTSFDADFEQVTSSNLYAKTAFDGGVNHANKLKPGDIKTFALYYSNHKSGTAINLEITDLTSQTINKVNGSYHRYISTTSTEVNIGWAINMYSMPVTSLTNHKPTVSSYSTFVASDSGKTTAEGAAGTDRITLAYGSNVVGKKDSEDVELVNTAGARYCKLAADASIDLFATANESATEGYIFYSIVFRDDVELRCKEVDGSGNDLYLQPAEGTRYFVRNTSNTAEIWNSNCYSDLTFAIHKMNFVF